MIINPICGKCLHAKSSHEQFNHNGKFMYCGCCDKLCPISEYNTKHHYNIKSQPFGASMLK